MDVTADEGEDPGRLLALADGVFAIAITLLVLNVGVRPGLGAAAFRDALRDAVPEVTAYALSFVVISALWRDHRRIFRGVVRVDESLTRLTLLGLGLVALLPFPTTLLAEYGSQAEAVAVYSGAVGVVDAVQLALLLHIARHPRFTADPASPPSARLLALDLVTSVVVFAAAIPVAFVSPGAAKWCWAVLIPVKLTIAHRRARSPGHR